MVELRIVRAGLSDAERVAELLRASFRAQVELLGISEAEFPAYVGFQRAEGVARRISAGNVVSLGLVGDRLAGTVTARLSRGYPGAGEIVKLAVHPGFRGHGFGGALVSHAESQLLELGVERVVIGMVAQFERLRRWYESLGYEFVRSHSLGSFPFDNTVLEKVF